MRVCLLLNLPRTNAVLAVTAAACIAAAALNYQF